MVRWLLVQAITSKPANGDADLSLTDQLAIVYDAGQQTREHQANRGLRIDAWPTVVRAIAVGDLFP